MGEGVLELAVLGDALAEGRHCPWPRGTVRLGPGASEKET